MAEDDHLYQMLHRFPYNTLLTVDVKDHKNGLPITIGLMENDPPGQAFAGLAVSDAERVVETLKRAIKSAKKAGL